MELIIIRHGQSEYNARISNGLDTKLTDLGHSQASSMAAGLSRHIDISGFLGICSPYLRTIETAAKLNALGVPFVVHCGPREHYVTSFSHQDLDGNGGVYIPKRDFREVVYPPDQWHRSGRFFPRESIETFVERLKMFWYDLVGREQNKFIVVSHGAPCRVIAEFATGITHDEAVRLCTKHEDALECKEGNPDTIFNCDAIYIKDGEMKWRRSGIDGRVSDIQGLCRK